MITKYIVDKESGDLGISEQGNTQIEQIPLLVMRIADIFSKLSHLKTKKELFCYCIQFSSDYKDTVKSMLRDIKRVGLPEGTGFYEIDGINIFDIRGASGGISCACCFYLIAK